MTQNIAHIKLLLIAILITSSSGCSLLEKNANKKSEPTTPAVHTHSDDDEIRDKIYKAPKYNLARPLIWKQDHVKAKLQFNMSKEMIIGDVALTFTPNIPSQTLSFDAIGFELISSIKLINSTDSNLSIIDIDYKDSTVFNIDLSRQCTKKDTFTIAFKYSAVTNNLFNRGLIKSANDKGLFFINPSGLQNKPTQIWSQGETQSNSAWLPCIDAPNQKISQEIYLTVDTPYSALSNGRLVYMLLNKNGTRTYYWKQDKKHAPYLTMLAVGKFAIIEDEGPRDLPLYYYVEPQYAKYAKMIFGKTPKIISFFELQYGVDFPWDKYAQVCVRNFISGAMENTSATTIMNSIQQDSLSYADYNYENYIVHEIAHQWFGDLVTCESWANLAINEAFATYAEYLWIEHEYGAIKAYEKLSEFRDAYFIEAQRFVTPLINYGYNDKEDMFNRHSYQKGALFLHTLRNEIGDDFFFAGLKHFLIENAFTSVDFDELRHSFEEVSGRDLSFFFYQYAELPSHPWIMYEWEYVDSTQTLNVYIKQNQSYAGYHTYNLSLPIEIGFANKPTETKTLKIDQSKSTFSFKMVEAPIYAFASTTNNPLIEIEKTNNSNQWIHLIAKPNIEQHLSAIRYFKHNWNSIDQKTKNQAIDLNNNWGRGSRNGDFFIITSITNDSIFYDITPLLKSNYNLSVSQSIKYLGKHNRLGTQTLNQLFLIKSANIKRQCLYEFKSHYNNETEALLVSELKKPISSEIREDIISTLAAKGSIHINSTLQKQVLKSSGQLFSYNFYATTKGYDFFNSQLPFYQKLKILNILPKNEFQEVMEHLEQRVKIEFEPTQQMEALKKIDGIKY